MVNIANNYVRKKLLNSKATESSEFFFCHTYGDRFYPARACMSKGLCDWD